MKNNKKRRWKFVLIAILTIVLVGAITETISYFLSQKDLKTLAQMNTIYSTVTTTMSKGVSANYTVIKHTKVCTANGSMFSFDSDTGWAEFCNEQGALLFPVNNQEQAQAVANQIYSNFGSTLPVQEGQSVTNFATAYNDAANNPAVSNSSPDNFSIVLPESGGFSSTLQPDTSSLSAFACDFEINYAVDRPITTLYGNLGLSASETNHKVVLTSYCTAEVSHILVLYPLSKHGY